MFFFRDITDTEFSFDVSSYLLPCFLVSSDTRVVTWICFCSVVLRHGYVPVVTFRDLCSRCDVLRHGHVSVVLFCDMDCFCRVVLRHVTVFLCLRCDEHVHLTFPAYSNVCTFSCS